MTLNYLVKIGNQMKKVHVDHMLPNSLTDNDMTEKSTTDDWDFGLLEMPPTQEPPTNNDSPSASSSDNTEGSVTHRNFVDTFRILFLKFEI